MNILKNILLILHLIIATFSKAQEYIQTENIADANGAVDIVPNVKYKVQLTGDFGNHKDFLPFKDLGGILEENTVFFKYTAEENGLFSLYLSLIDANFQAFIFKNETDNIIKDMTYGIAELMFSEISFVSTLSLEENKISMKQGESLIIGVNTLKKKKLTLNLIASFEYENPEDISEDKTKIIDNRRQEDRTYFSVKVRDLDTKEPINASVSISDKRKSHLLNGSDIIVGNEFSGKVIIKCDAPSYFFNDTLLTSNSTENQEITIYLRSVNVGKVLKIDKIEFLKGTSNLIPGKEAILNRVRDFLVLNSDVRIEVQGHVNNEGKENLTTKSLSKRRAKTIVKYFVDSGIDKKRLEYKGFGSDHPIYPLPKTEYEQQANRRVEIRIID